MASTNSPFTVSGSGDILPDFVKRSGSIPGGAEDSQSCVDKGAPSAKALLSEIGEEIREEAKAIKEELKAEIKEVEADVAKVARKAEESCPESLAYLRRISLMIHGKRSE